MPRHLELSISGILGGSLSITPIPSPISENVYDRGGTVIHNGGRFRTKFKQVDECIQNLVDLLYEACQKQYDRVSIVLDNDKYRESVLQKIDILSRLPGIRIKSPDNKRTDALTATYRPSIKRLVRFHSKVTQIAPADQELAVMTDEDIEDMIDDACKEAEHGQASSEIVSMDIAEAAGLGIKIPDWVLPIIVEEKRQREQPKLDLSDDPRMQETFKELDKIFNQLKDKG